MSKHQRHHGLHGKNALQPLYSLRNVLCFCVLATLAHTSVQAQTLYRSVGPDGRITFSDKPPASAARVTPLSADGTDAGTGAANAALPYALRQVVSRYPVTLFTSKECAPCDQGRTLLRSRGIPYSEKTITSNDDAESLKRLADTSSLPLLTIGSQQIKGYSSQEWTQYLNAAGYPEESELPASYRYAEPSPLVTLKTPTTPAAAPESSATPQVAPAAAAPRTRVTPNNPAGIQF
ncbi:glutaredoxin [Rhodoferax antarcticus ANT.BR]|uniref:Glutaredoxin n=1 Tax=Rhodoferax antarcticus ANT.BR TaxID=1111071 RepID=A0A1Q8YC61_9BURK|nr:glutaredoxin [Rhodoferax antarcticus ANT.BR]